MALTACGGQGGQAEAGGADKPGTGAGAVSLAASVGSPPSSTYLDDGRTVAGLDRDVSDAAAKVLGLTVRREVAGFEAILPALGSGKYQAGTGNFSPEGVPHLPAGAEELTPVPHRQQSQQPQHSQQVQPSLQQLQQSQQSPHDLQTPSRRRRLHGPSYVPQHIWQVQAMPMKTRQPGRKARGSRGGGGGGRSPGPPGCGGAPGA